MCLHVCSLSSSFVELAPKSSQFAYIPALGPFLSRLFRRLEDQCVPSSSSSSSPYHRSSSSSSSSSRFDITVMRISRRERKTNEEVLDTVKFRRLELLITLHVSYGMSLDIWDHTVLPATLHKWTHPALTSARGRYSIYLPRRDRRLSWPRWPVTYTEMVYPPTDGHPSKY